MRRTCNTVLLTKAVLVCLYPESLFWSDTFTFLKICYNNNVSYDLSLPQDTEILVLLVLPYTLPYMVTRVSSLVQVCIFVSKEITVKSKIITISMHAWFKHHRVGQTVWFTNSLSLLVYSTHSYFSSTSTFSPCFALSSFHLYPLSFPFFFLSFFPLYPPPSFSASLLFLFN